MDAYTGIKIYIRPWDETISAYPVEASLNNGAVFKGGQLHLDQRALLIVTNEPEEYGRILFNSLFTGPILQAYHEATGYAQGRTGGRLRVRLLIDEGAPELHALSWELLYHEHRGHELPLAASALTPFSRYTELKIPEPEPISERPIRLFIAIANPRDLPADLPSIDVEREIEHLLQTLRDLRQAKQVQITLMHGRTVLSPELRNRLTTQGYQIESGITSLENIMRILPDYHVFHFLGHGRFKRQGSQAQGSAALFLEKEDGTYVAVTDEDLILKLATANSLPHLVFLEACESARREADAKHPFVGLGPRLVQAGVPAVVAMQARVTMDLARQVMSNFYQRLMEHGIVDRALNEARRLLSERDTTDWAIPVLFTRLAQAQLFTTDPTRSTPFPAQRLPPYFVSRPDVNEALEKALSLTEKNTPPDMPVATVIHGMGGIGKSTQAFALAQSHAVSQYFTDGVLWVTLRQDPHLLSLLNGWIQELGDNAYLPTNIEAASNHLRALLQKQAVLLIVDDAWDIDHVKPFEVGGPRCRMLITTREASIASKIGVEPYNLDVMESEQALDLLAKPLGRELNRQKERDEALSLARIVGYLPLALELAAAQIVAHVPWATLLRELSEEIARLEALNRPEVGRDKIDEVRLKELSLIASFNLSLRRLGSEERRMFAWLGVLSNDVTLTAAMTTTLWNTTEREAQTTLLYLHNKALIQASVPRADGTLTFHLHDLQHAVARRLLTDPSDATVSYSLAGFGLSLQATHATLLELYKSQTKDNLWYTLLDDGYIYAHLTWHMEKAGQIHEIHTLLYEEDGDRNAWYQACEHWGQTMGFLEGIFRAWKLAEQDSEKRIHQEERAVSLSLELYYTLVITSINTLAQNMPPVLLAALVEKDIWEPTQGLAYAQRIPELEQRAKALVAVAPYLAESSQDEILRKALAVARAIETEQGRTKALTALALQLGELVGCQSSIDEDSAMTIGESALSARQINVDRALYAERALMAIKAIRDTTHQATVLGCCSTTTALRRPPTPA